MLGLFQPGKFIKRHFWIILLFSLALQSNLHTKMTQLTENPLESIIQVFFFYGFIILVAIGIAIIPLLFLIAINNFRYENSEKLKKFIIYTRGSEWVFNVVIDLSVIVASLMTYSKFGTEQIATVGGWGLLLLLIVEIFDIEKFFKPDLLKIEVENSGKIVAHLIDDSEATSIVIQKDLIFILAHLENSNWKQININFEGRKNILFFQKN